MNEVKVKDLVYSVWLGVYSAILLLFVAFCLVSSLLFGHHSLREIGSPCRDHGGVAQYIPGSFAPLKFEPATVVCKDGKVGRV